MDTSRNCPGCGERFDEGLTRCQMCGRRLTISGRAAPRMALAGAAVALLVGLGVALTVVQQAPEPPRPEPVKYSPASSATVPRVDAEDAAVRRENVRRILQDADPRVLLEQLLETVDIQTLERLSLRIAQAKERGR